MTMVRLVPGAAGSGNWHRADDFSVTGRVFVEVDDRQEVRRHASLVAGPDVKRLWRLLAVAIAPSIVRHRRDRDRGERDDDQDHRGPRSKLLVGSLHIAPSAAAALGWRQIWGVLPAHSIPGTFPGDEMFVPTG